MTKRKTTYYDMNNQFYKNLMARAERNGATDTHARIAATLTLENMIEQISDPEAKVAAMAALGTALTLVDGHEVPDDDPHKQELKDVMEMYTPDKVDQKLMAHAQKILKKRWRL